MKLFDQIDPLTIDRREEQLWMLALIVIFMLSVGMALLMYPSVFSQPVRLSEPVVQRGFFGFCVLSILLVGYLIERQVMIRRLRKALHEEYTQNLLLRRQASADVLEGLPGFGHFQDRLPMEFRRAVNLQQALSLLLVRLDPSPQLTGDGEVSAAFGDAAKTLVRKLRGEDSIYLFSPGLFGVVLPGVLNADAGRVVERLSEGLRDASGASERFSFEVRTVNYPEHAASAREIEQITREYVEGKKLGC
jgi:GGDEF domain-containing protein